MVNAHECPPVFLEEKNMEDIVRTAGKLAEAEDKKPLR